jgi:heterodisulfide reductase subunit A-like polyferredoxin
MKKIGSVEKNTIKPFTDEEIDTLSGSYSNLARKYNCSPTYVRNICIGKSAINTDLAKLITRDLHNLLNVLKPENNV